MIAHHRADVSRQQKSLHAAIRRTEDGVHGRRHAHVRNQNGIILQSQRARLEHAHHVGRGGGLEADREEDHLLVRVLARDLHRVQRRIDDAHLSARGFHREQVPVRAGDAQHVAVGAEDHVRLGGDQQRLVNQFERGHTNGTARPVYQLNERRQDLVQPVADDRMRLSPANFHDDPRARHHAADLIHHAAHQSRIAIFGDVFHAGEGLGPSSASMSVICLSKSSVSLASSSLNRLSAKPTWTMQ